MWQIRQENRLYIAKVAKTINVPERIIEGMELGKFAQYTALRRLLDFYGEKIKISLE